MQQGSVSTRFVMTTQSKTIVLTTVRHGQTDANINRIVDGQGMDTPLNNVGLQEAPSLNTQSCIRRPLCSTFRFENLRSPKKNEFFHVFGVNFFLIIKKVCIMQLFSEDAKVFSNLFILNFLTLKA